MAYHEPWVLFARDVVTKNQNTRAELLRFLKLDQYPEGLIFWIDGGWGSELLARRLISRKPREKSMFITRFDTTSMMNMCSWAICSSGRPLRGYYTEIARLGFGTGTFTPQHPLWDPNLISLVVNFLCGSNS